MLRGSSSSIFLSWQQVRMNGCYLLTQRWYLPASLATSQAAVRWRIDRECSSSCLQWRDVLLKEQVRHQEMYWPAPMGPKAPHGGLWARACPTNTTAVFFPLITPQRWGINGSVPEHLCNPPQENRGKLSLKQHVSVLRTLNAIRGI